MVEATPRRLGESEVEARLRSLLFNADELERRVRYLEKVAETDFGTPWWKKIVFFLDGWPMCRVVNNKNDRQWRPWHRWLPSS